MFDSIVKTDVKKQIKNIKKLNTSLLMGLPANSQDINSEIISKIGVLYGLNGDNKRT